MRYVIGRVKLRPGSRAEYWNSAKAYVETTRREDGCIFFDIAASFDDPDGIVVAECWDTAAAHALHLTTDHYQAARPVFEAAIVSASFEDIESDQVKHFQL